MVHTCVRTVSRLYGAQYIHYIHFLAGAHERLARTDADWHNNGLHTALTRENERTNNYSVAKGGFSAWKPLKSP